MFLLNVITCVDVQQIDMKHGSIRCQNDTYTMYTTIPTDSMLVNIHFQ